MNNDEIRTWLDREWANALANRSAETPLAVANLANSSTVSIRYALVTQLLGKIADPSRSLFALQLQDGGAGAWDARSFATAVVVPWVAENQSVLGTSSEPYASKPLRRERLTRDMTNVRSPAEWNQLYGLFEALEAAPREKLHEAFGQVLQALARRLDAQSFSYPIPKRISMAQLAALLGDFLGIPSGGLRPMAVATALFTITGKAFSLFSRVQSQGLNEADAASGMPGDIVCMDGDRLCLVAEVKDANLTLAHLRDSSIKAKKSKMQFANLVFATPGIRREDRAEIAKALDNEYASGLNIHVVSIHGLCHSVFALLDESWRIKFLAEVGADLDRRMDAQARKGWHDALLMLSG